MSKESIIICWCVVYVVSFIMSVFGFIAEVCGGYKKSRLIWMIGVVVLFFTMSIAKSVFSDF